MAAVKKEAKTIKIYLVEVHSAHNHALDLYNKTIKSKGLEPFALESAVYAGECPYREYILYNLNEQKWHAYTSLCEESRFLIDKEESHCWIRMKATVVDTPKDINIAELCAENENKTGNDLANDDKSINEFRFITSIASHTNRNVFLMFDTEGRQCPCDDCLYSRM